MSGITVPGMIAAALIAFVGAFIAEPILLGLFRMFGIYTTVAERTCRVYVLFGRVIGVIDEPPAGQFGRGRADGHRHLV